MAEGDPFIKEPNPDNPYVSPEEQGMEMEPHVMAPPPYGSPDPQTSAASLVPIEDHPLADNFSDDYAADLTGEKEEENGEEDDGTENATAGAVELAEQEGVDLSQVEGTGKDGKITKADVENFLASKSD